HRGAFLLAGDAACVTSPYGGQGLTTGLDHVEYLLDIFDFRGDLNARTLCMTQNYAEYVRKSYCRISLLNFGLYYLFFARPPVFRKVSAHILNNWEADSEMKERVIRLFAGLDRDIPSTRELLQLWGVGRPPIRRLALASPRLSLRAIGSLWENFH